MGAPIKRSLHAPVLWAGVERVPGIVLVMVCLTVSFAAVMLGPIWLVALAIGGFFAGWSALRVLAEREPMFFQIVLRWLFRRSDVYKAVRNIDD
ncbi:MAG: VirB3 family type IV secretion system protein [Paracoccaceae bacterium]|nr:VirB3 family type IV secretion system protein [Paracoccaceae bacterium]